MNRHSLLLAAWALGAAVVGAAAAEPVAPAAPRFELVPAPAPAAEPAPIARVLEWITQHAPECPPSTAPEVAAGFLEQLGRLRPGEVDRLGTRDLPVSAFESLLWQTLAARLAGPAYQEQRSLFAQRRVAAVLTVQGGPADPAVIAAALARLKTASPAALRRLEEGRMEDDELARLPGIDPARETRRQSAAAAPAAPRVLTAQEIAGEFARRNQAGAAAARLRAYTIEAQIRAANGTTQELLLFKLRPGRFRVHLRTAAGTTQILAFDGQRYWRQSGARVEQLDPAALGALRYLGEFVDPLFEPDGRELERLEDGVVDGRKCYRLRVGRPGYIAVVDQENLHQVLRENADGSRTRYADFRDFAGLTVARREEFTPAAGPVSVLEITRLVANPGLIGAFFAVPQPGQLDLDSLERALAPAPAP